MRKTKFIEDYLEKRKSSNRQRELKALTKASGVELIYKNRSFINFSSNNYLGLADHPLLKKRAIEFAEQYGIGASASRLVCGNFTYQEEVERKLAKLMGSETALIFSSGYQVNTTLLPALADRHSLILTDKYIHHSMLQGALTSKGKILRFRHNDLKHLESLLNAFSKSYSRIWIATESLFSMHGDKADIESICALAKHHDALLYVDDAHACGTTGFNGMGQCSGKSKDIDIIMGSFGKAVGCSGGYISCSKQMREYIIQTCGGFIYSTALPAPIIGAIDAALELIPNCELERQRLQQNITYLKRNLKNAVHSHIIPIYLGSEKAALSASEKLEKIGIYAPAIRPPTVPVGSSCIRISLSALHTEEHLNLLIGALHE